MNLRPCPFCGEKLRVKIVPKHMRRANGRDFAPAAYGYCVKCKSRGPLIVGDAKDVMNNAAVAWNGFTATPTHSFSAERPHREIKNHNQLKKSPKAGLCSEERSMIEPAYARNFICDFILGGGG